jgi:RHS repeat-associated protein
MKTRILRFFLLSLTSLLFSLGPSFAQVTNVTDVESTPIPGAGHDYLHMLDETVNPANGSVSVRIKVPIPKGRGLTLPFSFAYDSNGAVPIQNNTVNFPLFRAGWSYSVPAISYQSFDLKVPTGPDEYTICPIQTDYVFYDAEANRHSLNSGGAIFISPDPAPCPSSSLTGGDPLVSATATGRFTPLSIQNADGTTYSFSNGGGVASTVEDRNGNFVQYQYNSGTGGFTATDTAGRLVVSANGFGATGNTVSVSGLGNSYSLSWSTTTYNYSINMGGAVYVPSQGDECEAVTLYSPDGSSSALSTLNLPNGQSYQFTYDPVYGVLKKIQYPDGGWVQYTWGMNSNSEMYAGPATTPDGEPTFCYYRFSSPVITQRQVSYDGIHVAETQTFTNYTTNWGTSGIQLAEWTTKSTTVTTTDNVRNKSFATVYTYSPVGTPNPPELLSTIGTLVPVEQQIVYNNWDGTLLQTVNKAWLDQYRIKSQQTVLPNGAASQVTYTYGNLGTVTNKSEFDYGQSSPTRQTIYSYQSFVPNPLKSVIYDRPCQVLVEDGNNNQYSVTDYFYDNSTTLCTEGTPSVASAGGSTLTGHDETNYSTTSTAPRGNVTQKTQVENLGTSPVTTYAYDETGKVVSVTDPNGNVTGYSFADSYLSTNTGTYTTTAGAPPSGTVTNAYATQITYPQIGSIKHIVSFTYGYNDGELTTAVDENLKSTTYRYNDNFDRITETDYPDTGQTLYTYKDSAPASITTCKLINGTAGANCSPTSPATGWETSVAVMDGIGHVVQTQLASDPDGVTYTATTYDGSGRPYTVTNPYRGTGDSTYGVTTQLYDALGRTCLVVPPDFAASAPTSCPSTAPLGDVLTSYSSNASGFLTTVTDEIGNQRTNQTDGLGRLTYVWEAPNNISYDYQTVYTYDPLNNLLSVNQTGGSRTRTFTYDYLSRLLCAANPEVKIVTCPTSATGTFPAGAITYTYDADGNLLTKVAPKPGATSGTATVTTTYAYDALNRLTEKSYAGLSTTPVKFGYDGGTAPACGQDPPKITGATNLIGRRSAMCSYDSGSSWSYDSMGRPLIESRTNKGSAQVKLNGSYTYNLDGSLATLTYPSLDMVTYTPGGAGRPLGVSDSSNSYVANGTSNHATYAPNGFLASMANGYNSSTGFAGIVTSNVYNDRLQPILLSAAGASTVFSLCYDFHLGVAVGASCPSIPAYTGGDNGNAFQVLNNMDSTRSAAFAYDPLNRISQANTVNTNSTNCWGEAYTIDAWGNLTNRAPVPGMAENCLTEALNTSANSQNQLSGISYDIAGNVVNDGNGNAPTYDAENRIATDAGVTYSYDADGVRMEKSSGTMYWPGPSGEYLTETGLTGTINEEYIYFNGARIARVDRPSGTVHYYFSNHLGSASVITDDLGNIEEETDYYPFGGVSYTSGSDPNHYKFTGKERDSESGLDMFGARYYTSTTGRFMTPDWAAKPTSVPYANFGNPQSLNLYSYVENNPSTLGDPDGHVVGVDDLLIGGTIGVMALSAYMQTPAGQQVLQNGVQALSNMTAAVGSAISGVLHPNNNGQNAPPPPTVPTQNVPQGTPGSTSQQGAVNSDAMNSKTLEPGPYAGDGVPARGPGRDFTPEERDAVNQQGRDTGCHTCGTTDPGTKSGNFVPDHQPPSQLNPSNAAQRLYPQCVGCSRTQGGEVNAEKQKQQSQPSQTDQTNQ